MEEDSNEKSNNQVSVWREKEKIFYFIFPFTVLTEENNVNTDSQANRKISKLFAINPW